MFKNIRTAEITPIIIAASLFAIAPAAAQTATADLVVEAPSGLSEAEMRQWNSVNADARKLEKKIAKLETEFADDQSDVADAEKALNKARKKLSKERDDYDKTARKLEKARRETVKIAERRAELYEDFGG